MTRNIRDWRPTENDRVQVAEGYHAYHVRCMRTPRVGTSRVMCETCRGSYAAKKDGACRKHPCDAERAWRELKTTYGTPMKAYAAGLRALKIEPEQMTIPGTVGK